MQQNGISIEEACSTGAIGTQEDFEKNCNPDGTVKKNQNETTITIGATDASFTIPNSYLYAGIVALALLAVFGAIFAIKKFNKRISS